MRRNWMPLYIPDFLADTMHLSAAETGAYLCLIMDYWLHDGLPDDDRKLAAIARLSLKAWLTMRETIAAFFHDGWRHKRIDAELAKMVGITERRRAAGSKGGTASTIARWNGSSKRQANVQQTAKQTAKQNQAKVNHTTQEDITSTSSVAARARGETAENPEISTAAATPQESGSAMADNADTDARVTELQAVMIRKGWVKPC